MKIQRAYQTLLKLYPEDYRAMFGAEMLDAFENTLEERRGLGSIMAEFIGLMAGAEWIAKFTTDRSVRGRSLPDVRMMRPPSVPRELWFARACIPNSTADEAVEAEKRIAILISRMVHAIANHDFPGARSYSYQEREARENLRRLREQRKTGETN